ncbi:hypothetical protein B0A55_09009 [Friedmanniomyces simplex]|uniref:Uncharacterized protein n=1 Tax=Friedmanniomyces simplex TaxID=329884 RepID=A0A4U0WPD6_9PEZI|nr:hypothetical protein B0A55_09009 [Friedmanniomyces simplex]
MQLLYWPVTRPAGNLCGSHGSAITAPATAIEKSLAVPGNEVNNWPSANISILNVFATAANGARCGTVVEGFNVALPVHDLSTISHSLISSIGTSYAMYTQSIDLADLNYPVPWSAYRGMRTCVLDPTACDTVTLQYQPMVALPTWLTGIQEQWLSCTISTGVYDPPRALTVESQADVPTMPTPSKSPSVASAAPMQGASMSVTSPTMTAATSIVPPSPYSSLTTRTSLIHVSETQILTLSVDAPTSLREAPGSAGICGVSTVEPSSMLVADGTATPMAGPRSGISTNKEVSAEVVSVHSALPTSAGLPAPTSQPFFDRIRPGNR